MPHESRECEGKIKLEKLREIKADNDAFFDEIFQKLSESWDEILGFQIHI